MLLASSPDRVLGRRYGPNSRAAESRRPLTHAVDRPLITIVAMAHTNFVAARNTRHRVAALALYRALLRSGNQITALEDVPPHERSVGPLASLIRQRFAVNRQYTSYRLVYAAMAAGYKVSLYKKRLRFADLLTSAQFLTLLAKARDPVSPEHAKVVSHIREHYHPKNFAPSSDVRRSPLSRPPPLLRKISNPGEVPKYVSDILPRPKDAFKGDRKIPVFAHTAQGQPFLRLKKPQSPVLSKAVGLKDKRYARTVERFKIAETELAHECALEDEWDHLIQTQMNEEGFLCTDGRLDALSSFAWTAQLSKLWWEWRIERIWLDWVARGEALQQIVQAEKTLAQEEKQGPARLDPRHTAQGLARKQSPGSAGLSDRILEHRNNSFANTLLSELGPVGVRQAEDSKDPFTSIAWETLVRAHQRRLLTALKRATKASD